MVKVLSGVLLPVVARVCAVVVAGEVRGSEDDVGVDWIVKERRWRAVAWLWLVGGVVVEERRSHCAGRDGAIRWEG